MMCAGCVCGSRLFAGRLFAYSLIRWSLLADRAVVIIDTVWGFPSPRHLRAECFEADSALRGLRAPVPTLSRGERVAARQRRTVRWLLGCQVGDAAAPRLTVPMGPFPTLTHGAT